MALRNVCVLSQHTRRHNSEDLDLKSPGYPFNQVWGCFAAIKVHFCICYKSRDSSVGIALGYGLDDRGSRVRFPTGAENFSLHHRIQTGPWGPPSLLSNVYHGLFIWG
jgi:hypothetical protein